MFFGVRRTCYAVTVVVSPWLNRSNTILFGYVKIVKRVCRISFSRFYIHLRREIIFLFEKCKTTSSTWVGCTHPGNYHYNSISMKTKTSGPRRQRNGWVSLYWCIEALAVLFLLIDFRRRTESSVVDVVAVARFRCTPCSTYSVFFYDVFSEKVSPSRPCRTAVA